MHPAGGKDRVNLRRKKFWDAPDTALDYDDRFGKVLDRHNSDLNVRPPPRIPEGMRNYLTHAVNTPEQDSVQGYSNVTLPKVMK